MIRRPYPVRVHPLKFLPRLSKMPQRGGPFMTNMLFLTTALYPKTVYPACPMKSKGHFIGVEFTLVKGKRI